MGDEGCFLLFFLRKVDLPVSGVAVQCGKYGCVSEEVDEFVYSWYWVRVAKYHRVEPVVDYGEAE